MRAWYRRQCMSPANERGPIYSAEIPATVWEVPSRGLMLFRGGVTQGLRRYLRARVITANVTAVGADNEARSLASMGERCVRTPAQAPAPEVPAASVRQAYGETADAVHAATLGRRQAPELANELLAPVWLGVRERLPRGSLASSPVTIIGIGRLGRGDAARALSMIRAGVL
jgi:hypothetical protein